MLFSIWHAPIIIRYWVCMAERPDLKGALKATRPWWIVPIIVVFAAALALVLTDVSPLRQFAYTVF